MPFRIINKSNPRSIRLPSIKNKCPDSFILSLINFKSYRNNFFTESFFISSISFPNYCNKQVLRVHQSQDRNPWSRQDRSIALCKNSIRTKIINNLRIIFIMIYITVLFKTSFKRSSAVLKISM